MRVADHALFLRSADGRFAVHVPLEVVERLKSLCFSALPQETGGILVGRYSEDRRVAEVTAIHEAAPDSKGTWTSFLRGIQGICKWLSGLWRRRSEYYLGEWHFHPNASPKPSSQDVREMQNIAMQPEYQCPEPVMLIVGSSRNHTFGFHASVTTRQGDTVMLSEPDDVDTHWGAQ